jgi:hypothetical protein
MKIRTGENKRYIVKGKTWSDIYKDIGNRSPVKPYHAHMKWQVTWKSCTHTPTLLYNLIIPQLSKQVKDTKLIHLFDIWLKKLYRHEIGHLKYGIRLGTLVKTDVHKHGCAGSNFQEIVKRRSKQIKAEERRFDSLTKHGIS